MTTTETTHTLDLSPHGNAAIVRGYVWRIEADTDEARKVESEIPRDEDGFPLGEQHEWGYHGDDYPPADQSRAAYLADDGQSAYLVIADTDDANELDLPAGWSADLQDDLGDDWRYTDGQGYVAVMLKAHHGGEYTIATLS